MQTVHRTEAVEALRHEDNSKGTDGSSTDKYDPWDPPHPPPIFPPTAASMHPMDKTMMRLFQVRDFVAASRATNIILPDRTPQTVLAKFIGLYNRLETILKKDNVPCFLRLYKRNKGCMVWGFIITPQTLDLIIRYNALRCAKLVLEGKAPKINGHRANPNYVTCFGYFPLHQAAETFSVDMIKLLLRYGALANLRTSGNKVIEGLLPLHVAIENTCQHKYLEDNLLADQKHNQANAEYIYKLIHLLCLPEMKIFLDTVRLLASHTDNVVDELWNYIKHGKLVPAAILLLAAQRQFRNLEGFDTIKTLIEDSSVSLEWEECGLKSGKNSRAQKQLKEKKVLFSNALVLLSMILKAGEALDAYIQTHSEASREEVLGKVTAILQDYNAAPTGKGIRIEDLYCCPYNCPVPDSVLHEHGNGDVTKAALGSPTVNVEAKNSVIKIPLRGAYLGYARRMFFPHWRAVLTSRLTTTVFPSYVPRKELPSYHLSKKLNNDVAGSSRKKLKEKGSSPIRLGLLEGRFPQVASNYQSRRLFGAAASTLLKMLKRA